MRLSRERFIVTAGATLVSLGSAPAAAKKTAPIPGCVSPAVAPAPAPPRKIMLIRHGEKPTPVAGGVDPAGASDPNSLRVEGWQRAGALVRFFATPSSPSISPPAALFAGAYLKAKRGETVADVKSMRAFETLSPLAARLNLPVDACYPVGDEAGLAAAILHLGGVVLVAWEHQHIPLIARALPLRDASAVPAWPGARYDMVFVLDWDSGTQRYAFAQVPQLVLAGDSAAPFPQP